VLDDARSCIRIGWCRYSAQGFGWIWGGSGSRRCLFHALGSIPIHHRAVPGQDSPQINLCRSWSERRYPHPQSPGSAPTSSPTAPGASTATDTSAPTSTAPSFPSRVWPARPLVVEWRRQKALRWAHHPGHRPHRRDGPDTSVAPCLLSPAPRTGAPPPPLAGDVRTANVHPTVHGHPIVPLPDGRVLAAIRGLGAQSALSMAGFVELDRCRWAMLQSWTEWSNSGSKG
jgi:hypothetical protein